MQKRPSTFNNLVQRQHLNFLQTSLKFQLNLEKYPIHDLLTTKCSYYNPQNFDLAQLTYWGVDLIRQNCIKLALSLREVFILADTSGPIVKNLDYKLMKEFHSKAQLDEVQAFIGE